MALPTTEQLHEMAEGLDARPLADVAVALAAGQAQAAATVSKSASGIAKAAESMAATISKGGTLIYAAAGSSALMALADAAELNGTYGIPASQVRIEMAGGLPTGPEMPGATEDGTTRLESIGRDDTVIAVSASGTTPYTLAAAETARRAEATVVAIANNPDAPLLALAHHPICLETPPELIAGSTRMGAGTAQKIALNMLSTLMAVALGHVHDGMMVNFVADNAKLRSRAIGIVETIAGVDASCAAEALKLASGHPKTAVLIAHAGLAPEAAEEILNWTQGNLRAALARL